MIWDLGNLIYFDFIAIEFESATLHRQKSANLPLFSGLEIVSYVSPCIHFLCTNSGSQVSNPPLAIYCKALFRGLVSSSKELRLDDYPMYKRPKYKVRDENNETTIWLLNIAMENHHF